MRKIKLDLAESIHFDDIENPLALSTICTCPGTEAGKDAPMSTDCTCEGPKDDDCDAYARMMAFTLLTAEKFFGVFMHMGELQQKYHIQNVMFWIVLGTVLEWMGFIAILYSEIKAVMIVRERDERDRLVAGNYLERNEATISELIAKEEEAMTPRPYVTMLGAVLLWLGILLHLLPFCDILALIFPGLQFFHGMCWLFVIAVTLVMSAAAVLLTVGLIWSCTRGWAALVLVALGLSGELSVIGGSVWLLVWAISAVGVLYLYFKFLPDYLLETDGQRHSLLQDLGNWYKPSANVDDWMVAASCQGSALGNEGLGVVKSIPGGSTVVRTLSSEEDPRSAFAKDDGDLPPASGTV